MARTGKLFTVKNVRDGGAHYTGGAQLYLSSGIQIGTVRRDRATKAFVVFLADGRIEEGLPDFDAAERWAWANGAF